MVTFENILVLEENTQDGMTFNEYSNLDSEKDPGENLIMI